MSERGRRFKVESLYCWGCICGPSQAPGVVPDGRVDDDLQTRVVLALYKRSVSVHSVLCGSEQRLVGMLAYVDGLGHLLFLSYSEFSLRHLQPGQAEQVLTEPAEVFFAIIERSGQNNSVHERPRI